MADAFKQPADIDSVDVTFVEYLAERSDTAVSATATVSGGPDNVLTVTSPCPISGGIVKVWMQGGTSGATYKVTVQLTTGAGRLKEVDFHVRVQDL